MVEKGERGGGKTLGHACGCPKMPIWKSCFAQSAARRRGGKEEEEKMGRNAIFALLLLSNCVFSDGLHHHCQGGLHRSGKRIDAL